VIVSRRSGVTEIMPHCLGVDYWDVEDIADKILALLRHEALRTTLRSESRAALTGLSWDTASQQIIAIYNRMYGT
jgi:glycogen(starch) synthase